jgi:hypothetical protein
MYILNIRIRVFILLPIIRANLLVITYHVQIIKLYCIIRVTGLKIVCWQ